MGVVPTLDDARIPLVLQRYPRSASEQYGSHLRGDNSGRGGDLAVLAGRLFAQNCQDQPCLGDERDGTF